MSSELDLPTDSIPEGFAGASAAATCKRPFHATRPEFYPASVLSVIDDVGDIDTYWN